MPCAIWLAPEFQVQQAAGGAHPSPFWPATSLAAWLSEGLMLHSSLYALISTLCNPTGAECSLNLGHLQFGTASNRAARPRLRPRDRCNLACTRPAGPQEALRPSCDPRPLTFYHGRLARRRWRLTHLHSCIRLMPCVPSMQRREPMYCTKQAAAAAARAHRLGTAAGPYTAPVLPER